MTFRFWLPIQYRIIFKILLLVYKSLNGTSPSYLAQKLHYRSHTRSLRSVSNELLMQPRSYTKTYGDRAFAVHAPREWNLIPYEIRKSNTISNFKRSLKPYLFTKFSNNGSLFLQICIYCVSFNFPFFYHYEYGLIVALVLIFSFFTHCKYNRIWL